MSIYDATLDLQEKISEACSKNIQVKLEKGDYAIQALQILKNCSITIFSKDRVRIMYIGKRNRPLFLLEENALLAIQEKIEIYYNTNNIQELSRLMIKCPQTSRVEISKEVKISLFSVKS